MLYIYMTMVRTDLLGPPVAPAKVKGRSKSWSPPMMDVTKA